MSRARRASTKSAPASHRPRSHGAARRAGGPASLPSGTNPDVPRLAQSGRPPIGAGRAGHAVRRRTASVAGRTASECGLGGRTGHGHRLGGGPPASYHFGSPRPSAGRLEHGQHERSGPAAAPDRRRPPSTPRTGRRRTAAAGATRRRKAAARMSPPRTRVPPSRSSRSRGLMSAAPAWPPRPRRRARSAPPSTIGSRANRGG